MYIRMKYKYYHGLSKSKKLLDDDPVLEDCKREQARQSLKNRLDAGEITQVYYDTQRYNLLKMNARGGEAPPLMKLELHHGDLIVMHGEKLQSYYEVMYCAFLVSGTISDLFQHSVVPENKIRFALTSRYIKPDHVAASELHKGQFILSPDQVYNGQ